MSVTAPANQFDLLENQSTSPQRSCRPSSVTPKKPTYQSGSQPVRRPFKVDKQLKVEFIRGLTHGECCCHEAGVMWKDHRQHKALGVCMCQCAYFSWGVRTAYVCMACCRGEALRKLGVRRGPRSQELHSWGGGAVYFGSEHAMIMYAHVGPLVGVSWYTSEKILCE